MSKPSERRLRIAVDAAGGDHGPEPVVRAALAARDEADLVLVGPVETVRRALGGPPPPGVSLLHAPQTVGMADDPITVTWRQRRSSLLLAAAAVADGRADAMVTPGNTGAAVLAAAARLRRVPGVRNPALATVMPVPGATPTVLLDIGATAVANPEWLAEWAVLGAQYARARLGLRAPRVGLLSNGPEPVKGSPIQRDADLLLSSMPGYVGQIEAYDILGDRVDVAVTDGFTGDIALKMYERTLDATVGVAIAAVRGFSGAHADERERIVSGAVRAALAADPGAMLLGVRGVCVICHGAAPERDIVGAIRLAARGVRDDVVGLVTAAFAATAGPRRRFAQRGDR